MEAVEAESVILSFPLVFAASVFAFLIRILIATYRIEILILITS